MSQTSSITEPQNKGNALSPAFEHTMQDIRLEEPNRLNAVPSQMPPPIKEVDPLLFFATATSKNWEDPASVENAISLPSDPAIYGSIMGIVANPNLQ